MPFGDYVQQHATLLLVLIAIALIVIVSQIVTNDVMLNSLKSADASGFADSVRGLPQTQLVIWSVAMAVAVGGGVLLLFNSGARATIASDFGMLKRSVMAPSYTPMAAASIAPSSASNEYGGAQA